MSEVNESKTPAWAIVDLLGHLKIAGRFTEEEVCGVKMGRVDIPGEDGTFTTQYFGGQSVYRICLVSEAVARAAAKTVQAAPVSPWDYPKQLTMTAPTEADFECTFDAEDDDDNEDDPHYFSGREEEREDQT